MRTLWILVLLVVLIANAIGAMLIPNCGKEISEFAAKCPHCQFHINESNTDKHEVASIPAYAKNNLMASNISLKYQLIWSVVSAVFSVAAIIIARIFEIKIFDAKLGDAAVRRITLRTSLLCQQLL